MQIANQTAVNIHYKLTDDSGEELDASTPDAPMAYLHGVGNIITGLEEALEGKAEGDKVNVRIEPEKAYGPAIPELIQEVPREAFQGVDEIDVGMRFEAQTDQGPRPVVVTAVTAETVTVDGNHPLAGQHLTFDVEVASVRAASAEELEHGHVHGPGGHQH